MEIKDLAGLSKPISKLIDVFQNGCSWVLKPQQIKRIASAVSEASSIESNANFKKGLKEALLKDTINASHSLREKHQFDNVTSIYAHAAQELQMIENVDATSVNQDWSARFFDYSKDISDEEAQIVWAKILAGEIVKPGSFFKRTLSVLRDIETFEAKWFLDLCQFVLCDYIVPYYQFMEYYPYNQLQSLMDCGLLNSEQCKFDVDKDAETIYGKTLAIKLIDYQTSNQQISLRSFSLTDAGAQLYKITQSQTHQTYMMQLKEMLEQNYNLKLEIVQNQ